MFINPNEAIKNGWIKFPDWMTEGEKSACVQPNGIDITCDVIFKLNDDDAFCLAKDSKKMRTRQEISHVSYEFKTCGWHLDHGAYDYLSDFYVAVPQDVVAFLYPRSTLVRNGVFTQNGIFDSGFRGNAGGVIHNRSGKFSLEKGARIAQITFAKASGAHCYSGSYSHEQGKHWGDACVES